MSATDAAPPPKPPRRKRGSEFSPTPPPESVTKTTPNQSPSHLATDKKEAVSCIMGAIARRAPPSPPKDTARRANGDISINGATTLQTEEREKEVEEKKSDAFVVIDYLSREKPSFVDISINESDTVFPTSNNSSIESSPENRKGTTAHQKTCSKPIPLPRGAARKKGSVEDEEDDEEEEEEEVFRSRTAPVLKSYMSSPPSSAKKLPILPSPKLLKQRSAQSVDHSSSSQSDMSQKESPSSKKPIPMPRIQSYDESVLRKYGEQHFASCSPETSPKKPTPLPRKKVVKDDLKEEDEEIFPTTSKSSQSSISEPPSPIATREQKYAPPERQDLTTVAAPTTSLTTTNSERSCEEEAHTPELARRERVTLPAISTVPPSPRLTAPPNSPLPVTPISPSAPSAQAAPLAKPLPPPSPKPTPPASPSAKKPRSRQNYTPVKLRMDDSWINRSKQPTTTDPPLALLPTKPIPAPRERLPQSASTTQLPSSAQRHAPYRSTPILPQTSIKPPDPLSDLSKPFITSSGQYLPPGRPVTPDVTSSGLKSPGESERKEDVVKEDPKALSRFKKTRRSSSFSDTSRPRPISMMIDAVSDSKKEKQTNTVDTSC